MAPAPSAATITVGGHRLETARQQAPVSVATDDRFARPDIVEPTTELATFRWCRSERQERLEFTRYQRPGITFAYCCFAQAPGGVCSRPGGQA